MDKTIKLACLLAMVIFSSCASRKDFVYLQDMDELQEYPMVQKYEAIIHRDDRLSIIVNSKNPELSLPFNNRTDQETTDQRRIAERSYGHRQFP